MKYSQVVAGLVVMLGNAAYAQSWETVFTVPPAQIPDSTHYYDRRPSAILPDPFAPPGSAVSRLFVGMGSDKHPLYVVDLHNGTGTGTTAGDWRPISRFGYDPSSQSLFALGGGGRWVVRKSTDQGVSWTVVDSLTNSYSYPGCFLRDDEGNSFVSGTLGGSNYGSYSWIVRKSTDQGTTWTTVYQLPNARGGHGVFVPGSAGGLFVLAPSAPQQWIVRRSRDAGATWQIVDSFYKAGKITGATAIVSDAQGRIYVAGVSEPDVTDGTWEVRVSENGGDSWKTISPPAATAQINSTVSEIIVDPAGNLFVAGLLDAWAVARRMPDGVWQAPEFPFGTEAGWVPTAARAMAVDTVGNIFVAGTVKSGGPWLGTGTVITSSLVVQKLAATVLPPVRIARAGDSLVLSWPAGVGDTRLESADALGAGAVWTEVSTPPIVIGNEQIVTVDIGPDSQFFRLRKP